MKFNSFLAMKSYFSLVEKTQNKTPPRASTLAMLHRIKLSITDCAVYFSALWPTVMARS